MASLPWPSVTTLAATTDQQKCYHLDPNKPLGDGSFGVVFAGKDAEGVKVALKAFKPGPESATYHAQEAAMFDLLRGAPFTLQLIESFCDVHTGIPVLVTAPLCACTLQERIAMHAEGAALYSRDEALRWSLQLCTAVLDFMNRQVCHEDLSPRNILLTTVQGDVVVADPGVALKSRQYGIPSEQAMRHMSRTLAPEVTGGDRFDMRSDWFGVGACMCMLFMGSLAAPLGQDGVIGLELAEWIMQDSQAMEHLLPDESERAIVCEVLLGLLEPRPQDRMTPNLAINRLARLVPSWPLPGGEGMRRLLLDCEDDDMGDNGVFKLCLESGIAKHSNRGRIPPGQGGAQDTDSSYPEKEELREHYPDALYAMEEAWWRTLKAGPPIPKPGKADRQSSMEEDMFNPRNGPANLVVELAQEHAKLGQIWWALQLFDSALELAQGVNRPKDLALHIWENAILAHVQDQNRARALEILEDAVCRVEQWSDDATFIASLVNAGSLDALRRLRGSLDAPLPLRDRIEALAARARVGEGADSGEWAQADEDAALKTRREHAQRRTEALLYESAVERLLQLYDHGKPEALEKALALLPHAAVAWTRGLYVGKGPFIAWGEALRTHLCCPEEITEALCESQILARVEALLAVADASTRHYKRRDMICYVFLIRNENEGRSRPAAKEERARLQALIPDPWAEAAQWLSRLRLDEASDGEASLRFSSGCATAKHDGGASLRLCLRRADVAMGRAAFGSDMSHSQRSLSFQRAVGLYQQSGVLGGEGLAQSLHRGCLLDCASALVQSYQTRGEGEEGDLLPNALLSLANSALAEVEASAAVLPGCALWQARRLGEERAKLPKEMGNPDLAHESTKAVGESLLEAYAKPKTDWPCRVASRLVDLLLAGAFVQAAALCYPRPFDVGPTTFDSSLTRALHDVPYNHSLAIARDTCSAALESAGAYETVPKGGALLDMLVQARVELYLRDMGRTATLTRVLEQIAPNESITQTMEGLATLARGEEEGGDDWQAMIVEECLFSQHPLERGMQDKERHLRAGTAFVATDQWLEAKEALQRCLDTADGPETPKLIDLSAKLLLLLAAQQLGSLGPQSKADQRATFVQTCVEVLAATEPFEPGASRPLVQRIIAHATGDAAAMSCQEGQENAAVILDIAIGMAERRRGEDVMDRGWLFHVLGCKASMHLEVGQIGEAREALVRAKQVVKEQPGLEAAYLHASLHLAVVEAAAAMEDKDRVLRPVIEEVQDLLDAVLPRGPHPVRAIFATTLLIARLIGPHATVAVSDAEIDAALNTSSDVPDVVVRTLLMAASASPSPNGGQQKLCLLRTVLQADERRRVLGLDWGPDYTLMRLAGDVRLKLAQVEGSKAPTHLPAAVQAYTRDLAPAEPVILLNALSVLVNVMNTSVKPAPGKKLVRDTYASVNAVTEGLRAGGCQYAGYILAVGLFNISMLQRRQDALQSLERAIGLLDEIGEGGDPAINALKGTVMDAIGACRSCAGALWPYNMEAKELWRKMAG